MGKNELLRITGNIQAFKKFWEILRFRALAEKYTQNNLYLSGYHCFENIFDIDT